VLIRFIFLFLSLWSSSSVNAVSYQWGSADGLTDWNGSTSGGLIADTNGAFDSEELPTTPDGGSTATQYGIFQPSASDTLTIVQNVKIKGDVEIRFSGALPADQPETFTVNFGTSGTASNPVTVSSYTSDITTAAESSQLIFNPAQGKTIVVNMYANSSFKSSDATAAYDPMDSTPVGVPMPLHLTFRGKGSTIFRLPSGKTLYFGPPNPGHGASIASSTVADEPLSTVGVRVCIYMEQGSVDIFGDGSVEQQSQLVFEKWSYSTSSTNSDLSLDTWITFGQFSGLYFVSDNYLGISESWNDANNDGLVSVGETTYETGYGSVAFDPSSEGEGRLILQINRGQNPDAWVGNDFTDGGFNVYGALLIPTVQGSTRAAPTVFNADFRNGIFFNQRAGLNAYMRITDDVSYAARVGGEELSGSGWIHRPESDRRGLVVINNNNTIPLFANNYDNVARVDESVWGRYNDFQPGFILGVNGVIEVATHTFLDYIANNNNIAISDAHADVSTTHTSDVVKMHNPAALYTETVPSFEKRSSRGFDQFGAPISDLQYVGAGAGAHPLILLRGDGGLFVRSAAAYDDRALALKLFLQPVTNELYYLPLVPTDDTTAITVALGVGVYNGKQVSIVDAYNNPVMQSVSLDGAHALDIEGPCTIACDVGRNGEEKAGYFAVPSLAVDYAGRELGYTNFEVWAAWQSWRAANPGLPTTSVALPITGTVVVFDDTTDISLDLSPIADRPLLKNLYYPVYDRSTIFLNANLVFDSVQWIHGDVTRDESAPEVLPSPLTRALPHVVGGELAGIKNNLYPPLIKLYDSTLMCHESLVISGAALTVQERRVSGGAIEDNTSHIVCCNRGKALDTGGYGRVLQLGTQANVAADGSTTSLLMSSAHLDVYRAGPPTTATAIHPATITLMFDSVAETEVFSADRSLHFLYLANGSQVHLGWPTLEGDSSYLPAMMDNTVLTQLRALDPTNRNGFRFDPAATATGMLQFNGGPFYIGAGDAFDAAPPERPISGLDIDGVVYVNFGGLLSVTDNTNLFIDTAVGRRKGADAFASGRIVCPRDQVYFFAGGFIQDYDVDFATDSMTTGSYEDNIMLVVNDPIHAIDVGKLYETSDEDTTL